MPCDYKNTKPIIAMKDIKKEFSGVWALSGITFEVYPGEIHCLVGENGAGKSTLMKVLSGAYTPTEGTITVDGKEYSKFDPFLSKQLGINIVYQENDLVPSMDVVENIFVGNEKTKGLGIIDYPAMRKETQRQMDDLGIHLKLDTKIENLSVSDQQFVKILKALSVQPRVLIMDEPTSMFNVEDAAKVTELTRRIASMGIGIIYISHFLNEVVEIADRITVIRDGAVISTFSNENHDTPIIKITQDMVGRPIDMSDYRFDQAGIGAFVDLFAGDVDFPAVAKAIAGIGYDDYITLEMLPNYKQFPEVSLYADKYAMNKIIEMIHL